MWKTMTTEMGLLEKTICFGGCKMFVNFPERDETLFFHLS